MMTDPRRNAAGFTIIELMIAMMVFSVILLVATAGILNFSRQYYKGVIANQTQNAARTVIDDVTRAIQFNSGGIYTLNRNDASDPFDPAADPVGVCIGETKRYSFVLGEQIKSTTPHEADQSFFGLTSDVVSGCSTGALALNTDTLDSPPPSALNLVNFRELLGENMRLNKFDVKPDGAPGVYVVTVKVVYGDSELLCSPSAPGNECAAGNPTDINSLVKPDLRCRDTAGSQFCSVAELSTIVKKRVQ